jgi:hypothetical protein
MRRLSSFLAAIFVMSLQLLTVHSALAQEETKTAQEGKTYTWTIQAKKGEVARARTQMTMIMNLPTGIGFTLEMTGIIRNRVTGVEPNGDISLVSSIEAAETKVNGAQDISDQIKLSQKDFITLNRNGVVVKHRVEDSPSGINNYDRMAPLLASTPVPPKPVRIGDTWKTEMDNPLVPGKQVTLTSTLMGKEKIGKVELLLIKIEALVPPRESAEEKELVKIEHTYTIDPRPGSVATQPQRSKVIVQNVEIASPDGQNVKVDVDSESRSIVPSANAPVKKPVKKRKP